MITIDGESDVTNETSTSNENSPKQKRATRNRKNHQHFTSKQRPPRNNQTTKAMTNHQQQVQTTKVYEKVYDQQRYRSFEPPLRQHIKLNISEAQLVHYLKNYLLDESLMRLLGFPIEHDLAPSLAIIFKYPPYEFISQRKQSSSSQTTTNANYFNNTPIIVNANDGLVKENFGSEINDSDSGQGSGSSSPSDDYDIAQRRPAVNSVPTLQYMSMVSSQKECARCGKGFYVTNNGEYVTNEPCLYHWGKLHRFFDGQQMRHIYLCCNRDHDDYIVNGCTANRVHVWSGISAGLNGPYEGFVKTHRRPGRSPIDGNTGVFAVDCEMCYTGCGLELTKVSIVKSDGNLVYESFVRPERDIVDYNTRFSGITERDLTTNPTITTTNYGNVTNSVRRSSTSSNSSSSSSCSSGYTKTVKTLREVQKDLLKFIFEDTILIGHSIENDLKALKLIHKTIIDTSITFPHFYGLPYRRSLKSLTKTILKRDIQQQENGHCCFEDSRATLELMLWKVRKDFRTVLEQNRCG
jgi:RNA exonuclease 1